MASTVLAALMALVWARLVAVTLLGALDIAARRKAPPPETFADLSQITILVPAYNEQAHLGPTLAALSPLLDRGAALIVIDDGSADATAALARERLADWPRARVVSLPANGGKAMALNAGLALVGTALVLTVDADTRLFPEAAEAALSEMARRASLGRPVSAVAFDVAIPPGGPAFSELQALEYDCSLNFERRAQGRLDAIAVCPGAASLWRSDDLRAIGGFCAATATEDVDATLRLAALGKPAAHHPAARAETLAPATWRQLMAQRRRWCLGHYQNLARNWPRRGDAPVYRRLLFPNFALLNLFLPAMLAASLAALALEPAAVWRQTLWLATLAWLATIYVQRAIALGALQRPIRPLLFLAEPFMTAAVHVSALTLVVWGALAGDARGAWSARAR